jgi:hypothetical protein
MDGYYDPDHSFKTTALNSNMYRAQLAQLQTYIQIDRSTVPPVMEMLFADIHLFGLYVPHLLPSAVTNFLHRTVSSSTSQAPLMSYDQLREAASSRTM